MAEWQPSDTISDQPNLAFFSSIRGLQTQGSGCTQILHLHTVRDVWTCHALRAIVPNTSGTCVRPIQHVFALGRFLSRKCHHALRAWKSSPNRLRHNVPQCLCELRATPTLEHTTNTCDTAFRCLVDIVTLSFNNISTLRIGFRHLLESNARENSKS